MQELVDSHFERHQIEASKGVTLFVKTLGPREAKRKIVILHDLLDYHQCYLDLGTCLHQLGGEDNQIIWLDNRGHGLSTGNRFNCDSFDDFCSDLALVVNEMTNDGDQIVLMGQGLGGLIILRTMQNHFQKIKNKVSHLILSNPILRLKLEPPAMGKHFMGKLAIGLGKIFLPFDFESKIMTHDPVKSEIFVKDPLIGRRITYNFYREILKVTALVRQEVYYINQSCYLMIGEQDMLTDSDTSILFSKGLSEKISRVVVDEKAEHDIFNDICRDDTLKKLYDWMKEDIS